MKYLLHFALILLSLLIFVSSNVYAKDGQIDTAFHLLLNANSTGNHPTYFACFVTPSEKHPTLLKWTPKIEFANVYLMNYAQNVQGFTGLGLLKTTAGYLNQHYFRAYHDSDFKKSVPGFIDAFVLWAGYQINCKTLQTPNGQSNYTGPITIKYAGKDFQLKLAGNDWM